MVTQLNQQDRVIHVRFDGRSTDLPLAGLGLPGAPSDAQVRRALATHLEVPTSRLEDHVIDRHENGNLTLRPQAVFG